MKDAIAIAIARAKLRRKIPDNDTITPDDLTTINQELSRTILGFLLMTGIVIGLGALTCMVVGLLKSGGLTQFVSGLFAALGLL